MEITSYQLEKLPSRLQKTYGKIQRGKERPYEPMLYAIECNLLNAWRNHKELNSRNVPKALEIALYHMISRVDGKDYDTSGVENEETEPFVHAALMAVDPFTNPDIMKVCEENKFNTEDRKELKKFYTIPIVCFMRILDSASYWNKELGINGYFQYLENTTGGIMKNDGVYQTAVAGFSKDGKTLTDL